MPIRLTFAGSVGVDVDGVPVDLTALGRAGRMFWAYLACERHRPVPKYELAEVLWGDELPRSWEQMLRGNASKLRASLASAGVGPAVVVSAFGAYQVRLPADADVDVEEAGADLDRAVAALGAGDAEAAHAAAETAAEVAARGFLPGFSGIWVEQRQAELRELRLRALEVLGRAACQQQRWAEAVVAAESAVGIEPFRETAFQVLMAAHQGAGNPGEALRAYERCRRALAEELGVNPSAATESAYLSLLDDGSPTTAEPAQVPLPAAVALPPERALVGRKAQVDRLRSALDRAPAKGCQTVLVGGEPGIGKTALVSDFARQAHAAGADVLYGRCDEELAAGFQPFAEAIGQYLDHCALPEIRLHVEEHGGELARIAPQLMRRIPEAPTPRVTGSEGDRFRLFEAVTALLGQLSRRRPLVLVLDDLHWAAPPTLSLFRNILRTRTSPLVVVGTYRHTEVGPDHPLAATLADLWTEPGVERMLLEGLDEEGVAAFVEQTEGRSPAAGDDSLVRALHARTHGNPFFVGEFLRHLAESGAVYRKEGPWSYYEDREELGVPEGVRDVVARRLRRLSAGAERVLNLAAVVGLQFDLGLLEHVDDATEADAVLDALDEATGAHLVAELEPGRYQFAHALVRDTIYSTLTSTRRARLHHRVGDALASLPGEPDARLPGLAHHFAAAAPDGAAVEAADYGLAAARQAFAKAAWDDAIAFAKLGAGGLSSTEPAHLERRFDLLLLEIEAQLVAVRIPLAKDAMREAGEVARTLGSYERLARAATLYLLSEGQADPRAVELAEEALQGLGDSHPALRAGVQAGLAVSVAHRAAGRSDVESEAALALARRSGDRHALHAALVGRRTFLCETPRAQEWLAVEEELADLGPPAVAVAGSRWIHSVGRGRGIARLTLGDRRGFEADVVAVERWYTELHNVGLGTQLAIWRGAAALLDGRFGAVTGCASEILRLAPTHTDAWCIQMTRLALDQGRAGDAQGALLAELEKWPRHNVLLAMAALTHAEVGEGDQARRIIDSLATDGYRRAKLGATSTTLAYVADAVAVLADSQRAARLYELYAPYAGLAAIPGLVGVHCAGAVDRYLGQLSATLGRWDDAQRHYEAALVLEEGLRAPPLRARTRYWYARMLVERGRPGDAKRATALASAAEATAEELGMARLAAQAAELR